MAPNVLEMIVAVTLLEKNSKSILNNKIRSIYSDIQSFKVNFANRKVQSTTFWEYSLAFDYRNISLKDQVKGQVFISIVVYNVGHDVFKSFQKEKKEIFFNWARKNNLTFVKTLNVLMLLRYFAKTRQKYYAYSPCELRMMLFQVKRNMEWDN